MSRTVNWRELGKVFVAFSAFLATDIFCLYGLVKLAKYSQCAAWLLVLVCFICGLLWIDRDFYFPKKGRKNEY